VPGVGAAAAAENADVRVITVNRGDLRAEFGGNAVVELRTFIELGVTES
jgi:hypothetical protein